MLVPNRHASSNSYRYGFQGQEKDDELKGEGNSLNYTFRMHDPRVGRFFARDPLYRNYPWYSPYQFGGNRVIDMIELEGLEPTKPKLYWERLSDEAEIKLFRGKSCEYAVIYKTEGIHDLKDWKWNDFKLPETMYVAETFDPEGNSDSRIYHYWSKTERKWFQFDKNNIGASAEEVSTFAAYSIGGTLAIVGGITIVEAIGWATTSEFLIEESIEYAVEAATGFPVLNPKDVVDGLGVVYRRFNKATGKYYIGQSKSLDRFEKRKLEHDMNNPDAAFEFDIIGTAEPGTKLDVLEESFIRQAGVPTTKKTAADGTGTLENGRHQMNDARYKENGGTVEKSNN